MFIRVFTIEVQSTVYLQFAKFSSLSFDESLLALSYAEDSREFIIGKNISFKFKELWLLD